MLGATLEEQGHLTSQERGQHCSLGSLSTAESRQVLSVKQRPAAELMLHQGNPAEAVERLPSAQQVGVSSWTTVAATPVYSWSQRMAGV